MGKVLRRGVGTVDHKIIGVPFRLPVTLAFVSIGLLFSLYWLSAIAVVISIGLIMLWLWPQQAVNRIKEEVE